MFRTAKGPIHYLCLLSNTWVSVCFPWGPNSLSNLNVLPQTQWNLIAMLEVEGEVTLPLRIDLTIMGPV